MNFNFLVKITLLQLKHIHKQFYFYQAGKVTSIVTQNVDHLHHKAGSSNVIELHGTGYNVKCLSCPYEVDRHTLQKELLSKNPEIESNFTMMRPDGDVDLSKVS